MKSDNHANKCPVQDDSCIWVWLQNNEQKNLKKKVGSTEVHLLGAQRQTKDKHRNQKKQYNLQKNKESGSDVKSDENFLQCENYKL